MVDQNYIRVKVPCSTSNLGSGFDTVSAALNLYLTMKVKKSKTAGLHWSFSGEVPQHNIINDALRAALDYLDTPIPDLEIEVNNPIPLKRGLGSSGAAIIGGIKLGARLANRELTSCEILSLAYPLEGHPDNLAASLLGGWVISRVDGLFVGAERLPAKLQARYVVCIPEVEVSTSRAREILPDGYRLQDVAFNLQRVSLLIHALSSGRSELIREATKDRIHQNYRATLVPGMDRVLSLHRLPADIGKEILAVTISGSGSTVLAIVSGKEDAIGNWLVDCFSESGVPSRFMVLELDDHGAVLLG